MSKLKKCWITEIAEGLASVSFESEDASEKHDRLYVRENLFPANPTAKVPLRHTLSLGLIDEEGLAEIRDTIDRYLESE